MDVTILLFLSASFSECLFLVTSLPSVKCSYCMPVAPKGKDGPFYVLYDVHEDTRDMITLIDLLAQMKIPNTVF